MTKIAVIGGGQIGEALTGGLIASGFDGQDIVVTNRRAQRREEFEETYKVKTTDNNQQAVEGADVVFVCVKPYAIVDMFAEINDSLADNAVVVSMADRKSTRLNSSHVSSSYAVCCLKKKSLITPESHE